LFTCFKPVGGCTNELNPGDRFNEPGPSIFEEKFPISYQENRYRCQDGTYRFIRWSSQTKNNRVYAVGTDITVQKRIERELLIKEKKSKVALSKRKQRKHMHKVCLNLLHIYVMRFVIH
jgi:hypothetical protein